MLLWPSLLKCILKEVNDIRINTVHGLSKATSHLIVLTKRLYNITEFIQQ